MRALLHQRGMLGTATSSPRLRCLISQHSLISHIPHPRLRRTYRPVLDTLVFYPPRKPFSSGRIGIERLWIGNFRDRVFNDRTLFDKGMERDSVARTREEYEGPTLILGLLARRWPEQMIERVSSCR